MGYTHHWTQKRDLTAKEWLAIKGGAQIVISKCGVPLAYECDEPTRAPEISDELIRFNGLGEGGYETFIVERDGHDFQFCKTDRRPYDKAVLGVLAVLHAVAPDAFDLGSDGGEEALEEGRKLLKEWSA